ncbi:PREDICTED: probable WRKY transcription factor 70 [Fragaria vesca subsp. vesca]|uniref:probable WRKY transcription factor 70 n=1 Tax=Fragaria vesca subsp. vesca TaxID=101020 RepID=UPI0002C3730F|nr:PREDICTED: probable WRKY transcription factor 70 [Fragaria vesca subsp. vesca]
MEWTWPKSVSSNRQRVMEELVQGREMANQLRGVLSGDVRSAEGLVTKILGSLTNTLLILSGSQEPKEELIYSQIQANSSNISAVTASGSATAGPDSSSWDLVHDDAMKSEDSNEESCKSTETFKDRRGSYKRRKTLHSWTKDTLDLVDDGHAWRKYGQKTILNTTHPRNYFRCTHKFDQGCKATKHVQRIKDEPQLFRTTYIGNHTCTGSLRDPELILDCSSRQETSQNMIRFDSTDNALSCKQEHPFFSAFTSIKKESVKEEEMIKPISDHDHMTNHNRSSSSSDYLMSSGLGVFESSGDLNSEFSGDLNSEFSSTAVYDHDDVISRIMGGCFDIEVDFSYEF